VECKKGEFAAATNNNVGSECVRFSLAAAANNVCSMTPAQCRNEATAMKSEELAAYVIKSGWGDVLRKLVQLKPYIEVLWSRFDDLEDGQMIAGCRTKNEFSENCLNRSIRAVQYMLYGRAPAKTKANNVRPGSEANSPDGDTPPDADRSPKDEPIGTSRKVQSERQEIKTGQHLLREFAEKMLDVLTGKSVKNDAMRITSAVGLVKDLQRTIDEGKLFEPASSSVAIHEPPPSLIIGDAVRKKVSRAPVAPVEEPNESPLSDGRVQYSISEYYGEFAIWIEPRKREDTPFNTLPTREEAEAQVAILSAGGSIGGMAPRKPPTSVRVPIASSVAVNDDSVSESITKSADAHEGSAKQPIVTAKEVQPVTVEATNEGGQGNEKTGLEPMDVPAAPTAGTSLIYEPRGRAREYAELACNLYRGCDHLCTYCFAPSATYTTRDTFCTPKLRSGNFLGKLEKEAAGLTPSAPILLCFTTDPYQTLDVKERVTRQAIQIFHRYGHSVQILTKGGSRALRDLDLLTPTDAFATTLTSLDEGASTQWEPGAATPLDRIATVQKFHEAGIPTWVSLEPVISPAGALEIIRRTHGFVDLFKVGKLNYHAHSKTIDWAAFAKEVVALLDSLGCKYLLKEDLKAYIKPKEAA
jgi:DNA repair photolyase